MPRIAGDTPELLSLCGSSTVILSIAGNTRVTDKGLAALANAPALVQQLQEFNLDAINCTWRGVQLLLQQCTQLQKLELFGLQAPLQ